MESDSEIAAEESSSDIAGDPARPHQRAAHNHMSRARFYLLVACSTGFWTGSQYLSRLQESPLELLEDAVVIGAVLASWTLHPYHVALAEEEQAMRAAALATCSSSRVHGHVQWQVSKVAQFVEHFPLEAGALPGSVVSHHSHDHMMLLGGDAHLPLREVLEQWRVPHRFSAVTFAKLAPRLAAAILSGNAKTMHCVMVTGKINRELLFVPSDPSTESLTKFRKSTMPVDTSMLQNQDLQDEVK